MTNDKNQSLGESLPAECKRVREIMDVYACIPAGAVAHMLMGKAIEAAEKAMMEQDLPAMIAAYQELKGFEL